ncbi:unnamed protein product, partial [Closterium sp. Yama58-4]
ALSKPTRLLSPSSNHSHLTPRLLSPPVSQKPKNYGIQGFEETSFGGWLGLLLAVQRQPVVVRIEASAPSFIDYDGLRSFHHLSAVRGACMAATADPCGSKSVMLAGSPGVAGSNAFNPCGQFKCSKAGASNRCACAAPHFVQTAHSDGSNTCAYGEIAFESTPRTCAYVDACGLAGSNPCVVGSCVNDGKGSYSCVCPPGFVQGTTAKGTLSCAPGDSKGSYTVRGSNVWCSHLVPVLDLTLDEIKLQNKKLSCSKPIPVGFKLTVMPNQPLPSCSLIYTTHLVSAPSQQCIEDFILSLRHCIGGDSCGSIAALFGLSEGCPVEGEACEEALVGLNPGLDCAALTGRQAVCVEREESKAGMVAVCDQQYEMGRGDDGCDAARMVVNPPLSPLEFYRLNPGINCNNHLPTATFEGFSQRKVCIHSSVKFRIGTCPGGTYNILAGDTCDKIDVLGFSSIKGCYRKMNGFECLEKMPVGTTICTPDVSSARVGICGSAGY